MLVKGIEPPAYALRVRCSTPELHQQMKLSHKTTKNIITLQCENATPFYVEKKEGFPSTRPFFPALIEAFACSRRPDPGGRQF